MMKRSRYFEPYGLKNGEWKPTLSDKWNEKQAGIYFIREQGTAKPIYIGMSKTQLKKTIYRHFQQWDDSKYNKNEKRIVYEKTGYEIRFIYCTPIQAARLEKYFIQKTQPRDNQQVYENWFDRLTNPGEKALKELAQAANLAPFLKKDEYVEDFDLF